MTPNSTNGWSKAEEMVMYRLNQNDEQHEKIFDGIEEIKDILAEMRGKSKAQTWLFSTVFPAVISIGVALLTVFLVVP
jgi:hypothetical protein